VAWNVFAALNVLEGTIIADCQPRHRHPEFLRVPGARLHDHMHFTPTSSSWLNQIERWFAGVTRKRIRRGTFRSVRDLIKATKDHVRHYNRNPRPFQWVASASKIIRKVNKYKDILETGD
jgi:putative transposase